MSILLKIHVMRKALILFTVLLSVVQLEAQEDRRLNSLILETNVIGTTNFSYDRIIPVREKVAGAVGAEYWLGVGFGWGSHWIVPNAKFLFFGPKHYLETGLLYAVDVSGNADKDSPDYEPDHGPGFKLAYRYQTNGGFIIRASANVVLGFDPPIIPALGIGFAF